MVDRPDTPAAAARVLVVDDTPQNVKLLADILGGFAVAQGPGDEGEDAFTVGGHQELDRLVFVASAQEREHFLFRL